MSKNERAERTSTGGLSVEASGVEVHKSLVEDSGDVPTVQYDIRSDRAETVVIRLLDGLPPGVPMEAVGFHPEYHGSDWLATDGRVEFHHRLGAGESVVTVCGIQLPSDVDREALLSKPTIQVEQPSDGSGSDAPDDLDDDVTLDLEASEGTGTSSTQPFDFDKTEGMGTPDDDDVAGGADDLDLEGTATAEAAAGGRQSAGGTAGESVAAALAQDLRAGRISEEDRETLKRELNLRTSESANALLEHVKGKISRKHDQLKSEVDSLEASIEQLYGVKADAEGLDDVRAAVQRLDGDKADADSLEIVKTGLTELRDAAAEQSRVDRLENGLEELQAAAATSAELQRVSERLDRLEETAAELEELRALEERVETLETDVGDLAETAATEAALDDLTERVDHLGERTVDENRFTDSIEEIRSTMAKSDDARRLGQRIEDVESMKADQQRLDSLESTVENEYVAMENIDGTIERRVDKGVKTVFTLGVGTGAIMLSFVLAATQGAIPAAVAFAAGVLVIGAWWLLISDSSLR